ncbi:MAG: winged helix-turn-helix transcriptional regulator [Acidimicrobiia bacterium]|nr:winged helix-turn-helix transcriptional regulator [Actinomycetota bacterium]NDB04154.1 winged helix-turn-helix transcriptional regulator [Acidimicrobiia bacterium]NDE59086.1 winged helix-turn-helix transcriptional regulator [Acidimicrobiia bacterium]NDE79762.1 winged helix-turn-helix transcriptional regulator [Actinomycetota bacterium]NDF31191.1 winged helix-turn-helix transcriptional regulator [Acidimicrobiia bacterium]
MVSMAYKTPTVEESSWTFLTNHSHVLICIAKQPDIRLSEVADLVGIGERSVHRIVHDLESAGYLQVIKEGRRNVYRIDLDQPLRHPLEADHHVRAVITPLVKKIKVSK